MPTAATLTRARRPARSGKRRGDFGLELPLARVKRLGKATPDVGGVSQEAAFLLADATERFIRSLAGTAARRMEGRNGGLEGKCNLEYDDLAAAVQEDPNLEFLLDIVPERVTANRLLPPLLSGLAPGPAGAPGPMTGGAGRAADE